MAVVVMMLMANDVNSDVIVMLTIMVTATVIIIKSKMIKMVMMMIIVKIMIRQWILELLYIYTWKAFRFKHFAAFFFVIYSLNESPWSLLKKQIFKDLP